MVDVTLLETIQYSEPSYINRTLHEFKSGKKLKSVVEKKKTGTMSSPKEHVFILDDDETFIEVKDSKKKETKAHSKYWLMIPGILFGQP